MHNLTIQTTTYAKHISIINLLRSILLVEARLVYSFAFKLNLKLSLTKPRVCIKPPKLFNYEKQKINTLWMWV